MDSNQFNKLMNDLSSAVSGDREEPTAEDFKQMGWITLSENNDLDNVSNFEQIDEYRYIIRGISRFHCYNSKTDKWGKLGDKDDDFKYKYGSMAIDPITNHVFLSDDSGDIIEFDTFEGGNVIQKHPLNIPSAMLLLIEGELHAFGGQAPQNKPNGKVGHKVWNQDTNKIKDIKTFEKIKSGFMGFGFVYSAKRKEVYILGGTDQSRGPRDEIRKYSCHTKKWETLKTRLPQKMSGFGFNMGRDERYILISAPQSQWHYAQNNFIYILDLDEKDPLKRIKVSDIKLPWTDSRSTQSVIMDYKKQNELLVYGFIRNEMKSNESLKIPVHVIHFITNWHSIEYFYVMDQAAHHWKIHLDKILKKMHRMGMMQIM